MTHCAICPKGFTTPPKQNQLGIKIQLTWAFGGIFQCKPWQMVVSGKKGYEMLLLLFSFVQVLAFAVHTGFEVM